MPGEEHSTGVVQHHVKKKNTYTQNCWIVSTSINVDREVFLNSLSPHWGVAKEKGRVKVTIPDSVWFTVCLACQREAVVPLLATLA